MRYHCFIFRFFVSWVFLITSACNHIQSLPNGIEPSPSNPLTIDVEAMEALFSQYHSKSEAIYDSGGHWGQNTYGYRMALRDSYWRADVYLERSTLPEGAVYLQRYREVLDYLKLAQAQGGNGVFGVPSDTNNPEFGNQISQVIQACPSCSVGGWIIDIPSQMGIDNLYYDHGNSLVTMARGYLKTNEAGYLSSVIAGADWAVQQPASWNINYMSTLAKGLSYAYKVTNDSRYLNQAITLHRDYIIPHQTATGDWDDSHNALLQYHGFIVSGLIALKSILPTSDPLTAQLDASLALALQRMAERDLTQVATYEDTWPSSNVIAWKELSDLRALTTSEKQAFYKCLTLISENSNSVFSQTGFRLQKGLYLNSVIGFLKPYSLKP